MSTLTTIQSTDLITNSRANLNDNFAALNADKMETSVLDTDTTLAANSDAKVPTQKAVKAYVGATVTVDASEGVKGAVEEATDTEMDAGSATGSTGAKLFITPAKLVSFLSGFGDGSDGALSISSGTTTLTADKQYTSISVSGTAILETAGYRIYCQGTVTVDATSGACIRNNGGAGGNASAGTGGAAGASAPGVNVPAGIVGKAGANGRSTTGDGAAGVAGDNITLSIGVVGVAGGAGGSASAGYDGGAGGAAGTLSASSNKLATIADTSPLVDYVLSTNTFAAVKGSSGSGSGGAGGQNGAAVTSGAGGGSGASGGCVFIAAKQFTLSGTGAIQARGGAGGNGGNANGTGGGEVGGGGGGAGGAGGQVILIYHFLNDPSLISVAGGAGGSGGTQAGGASDGAAGTTGTTGKTYLIQV